ncbi:hypothetical protein VN97_g11327 [Penicillium thymicola]|uniref:Uncharacterized protein n=1 Tax=Penicillium thymicola TaxID=293382 RepID=A0AAI9T8W4_PENTH|nr:hypothetical protein VN97_g11327 [Penicillium thymicola]
MGKKSKAKREEQKARDRRNARDIQTPASTEMGSESESQKAESPRAQELRKASRGKKSQSPDEGTISESQQAESSGAQELRKASRGKKGQSPDQGMISESQQAESSGAQEFRKDSRDKKNLSPERRTGSESQQVEPSRAQELRKASQDKKVQSPDQGTISESQQAEPSRAQELRKASRDKKDQAPERRKRDARSPTRAGDFAPNASDYESDGETDLDSDSSDQDVLIEDKLQPLSRWVKDVIRSETLKESESMVEDFFTSGSPSYDGCLAFFQRLNQKIRAANLQHEVMDIDTGSIPETGYNALCQAFQQAGKKAIDNTSPEEFWEAYNKTYDLLTMFNKRHSLPKAWNISEAWAENLIGSPNPKIRVEEDTSSTSDSDIQAGDIQAGDIQADQTSEVSSAESDIDIENDHQPTGLDALEVRANKQQRQLNSAKVLYWWPKGTGSQIFVRYGSRSTPIYRIRAGSHESYNPSRVERVLTSMTRGTAKVTGVKNGLPEEFWKYQRKDVEDFVGIGWKVEEDDEQGFDPLNLLLPAKDIVYPQTRILVKWKDGRFTLEGRSFIRRITTGSALDGDRVIYQKAEELEDFYRKEHGLYDIEDDDIDTESDSSAQSNKARNRRHRSEPARYSNSHSQSSRHRSEPARYPSPHSKSSRHRSEPARYPSPHSGSSRHRSESARYSNPRSQSSRHRSEPARYPSPHSESSRHRSESARYSNPRSQSSRHRSEPAHYSHSRRKQTPTQFEDSTDEDSDIVRNAPASERPRGSEIQCLSDDLALHVAFGFVYYLAYRLPDSS